MAARGGRPDLPSPERTCARGDVCCVTLAGWGGNGFRGRGGPGERGRASLGRIGGWLPGPAGSAQSRHHLLWWAEGFRHLFLCGSLLLCWFVNWIDSRSPGHTLTNRFAWVKRLPGLAVKWSGALHRSAAASALTRRPEMDLTQGCVRGLQQACTSRPPCSDVSRRPSRSPLEYLAPTSFPLGGYAMPARSFPGSVHKKHGSRCRRVPSRRLSAARRVPIGAMGVARPLGSARSLGFRGQ